MPFQSKELLPMLKFGDAIKMLLAARSAMKRISANNSDFRLYKLLKNNSQLSMANQRTQQIYLQILWLAPNVLNEVMVEVDGIEPTTPCLQSRCSPS